MKILTLVTALTLTASFALAGPQKGSANWKDLASGNHSFKSLGTNFYVDVPVRRMENSKVQLSFVNTEMIERLGLTLPTNPEETEAFLKDLFAWEVDPEGKSSKKWFATHYQDSNDKGPGTAQGDGRALWTGELKMKAADGSILYIDGVQKGVGATPYAWLKNKSHSDGRQNTNELIISGIRSMADQNNNLDSTSDIVGFSIQDADGGIRTMTLRVGRQTRPAHIRYHSDNPFDERKMMDYVVTRDLGLEVGTKVTDELFLKWERKFARSNAEDTARIFVLNGFHEQPTMGNKTTTGGSIDLNGRQYMDAYHGNLSHLFNQLYVRDQVELQKKYTSNINYYLSQANYRPSVNTPAMNREMLALFDVTFQETAGKLFLHALGLSPLEISKVPSDVRNRLFDSINRLMRATGNKASPEMMMSTRDIVPAAYEMRKVIRGTMAAVARSSHSSRQEAMSELYKSDAKWASTGPNDHADLRANYDRAIDAVISSVGGRVKSEWVNAARARTSMTRFDATEERIWGDYAHPIRHKVEAGVGSGELIWPEVSRLMAKAANLYVDPQTPERKLVMLKPKVHFEVRSCSSLF